MNKTRKEIKKNIDEVIDGSTTAKRNEILSACDVQTITQTSTNPTNSPTAKQKTSKAFKIRFGVALACALLLLVFTGGYFVLPLIAYDNFTFTFVSGVPINSNPVYVEILSVSDQKYHFYSYDGTISLSFTGINVSVIRHYDELSKKLRDANKIVTNTTQEEYEQMKVELAELREQGYSPHYNESYTNKDVRAKELYDKITNYEDSLTLAQFYRELHEISLIYVPDAFVDYVMQYEKGLFFLMAESYNRHYDSRGDWNQGSPKFLYTCKLVEPDGENELLMERYNRENVFNNGYSPIDFYPVVENKLVIPEGYVYTRTDYSGKQVTDGASYELTGGFFFSRGGLLSLNETLTRKGYVQVPFSNGMTVEEMTEYFRVAGVYFDYADGQIFPGCLISEEDFAEYGGYYEYVKYYWSNFNPFLGLHDLDEESKAKKKYPETDGLIESIPPISEELQDEIWQAELIAHPNGSPSSTFELRFVYYGSYEGYAILFREPEMYIPMGFNIYIGDEEFHWGHPFEMLAYKDGVFTPLLDLYEVGNLSEEALHEIALIHGQYSAGYTK